MEKNPDGPDQATPSQSPTYYTPELSPPTQPMDPTSIALPTPSPPEGRDTNIQQRNPTPEKIDNPKKKQKTDKPKTEQKTPLTLEILTPVNTPTQPKLKQKTKKKKIKQKRYTIHTDLQTSPHTPTPPTPLPTPHAVSPTYSSSTTSSSSSHESMEALPTPSVPSDTCSHGTRDVELLRPMPPPTPRFALTGDSIGLLLATRLTDSVRSIAPPDRLSSRTGSDRPLSSFSLLDDLSYATVSIDVRTVSSAVDIQADLDIDFFEQKVLFLNLLEDEVPHFHNSAVTDPSMASDGSSLGEAFFARPHVSGSTGPFSTSRHDVTGDDRDTNTAVYSRYRVFVIEDMVKANAHVTHACFLWFYEPSGDKASPDVEAIFLQNRGYLEVEDILDFRYNPKKSHRTELLVKWLGFPEDWNSWKPVTHLYGYMPGRVRHFLEDRSVEGRKEILRECEDSMSSQA